MTVNCCWLLPNCYCIFAPNSFWDSFHEKKSQSLFGKLPRSFSAGSIVAVILRWGMPPGILPSPPRWGRALPILVISLILLVLEVSRSRQCFFEISSMPYGDRVGTNKIRTDPPTVAVPVGSPFLDVLIGNGKAPSCTWWISDYPLFFSKEVPARAVDDADVPVRQTYFALCFGVKHRVAHTIQCFQLL